MAGWEGLCRRLGLHHPTVAVIFINFGATACHTTFQFVWIAKKTQKCMQNNFKVLLRESVLEPLQDLAGVVPSLPAALHALELYQRSALWHFAGI